LTAPQAPHPDGEWLTVEQAAARLGLSPSGFRGLAETEGFEVRRRGNRPGVRQVDVDAYLERARIQPGAVAGGRRAGPSYFRAHEPYARGIDAEVPGLAEVNRLRDELGWSDAIIANALGIHFSNVSRRRVNGFQPVQIALMRRLIAEMR
jgi:hypothetical protein